MKFDGGTYLATTAALKLKGAQKVLSITNVSQCVDALYDSLYNDKSLDIPFGSIRYLEEKDEKTNVNVERLIFRVNNESSLNISEIEVGNRVSNYGYPTSFQYGALITANFKDGNGRIKGFVDLSEHRYTLAQASVIIDDKDDPYRGIYCIELKSRIDDTDKTVIEYFDGDTIDAIEATSGEYTLDDLASFSSAQLKRIGFRPDKTATVDYWPIEEKYNTEIHMVGSTYAHGTRAKFNEWVEKIFPKEETKKPEGQVLDKKFNG